MIDRLAWAVRRLTGRLWFRAGAYGFGAVAAVVLATWSAPLVPSGIGERVTEDAVRGLLEIMASSMLVVATFSLGTMVTAFTAAASTATPRASTILIEDPISQNVLATFVGAFVFSIIGLVAMTAGYAGDDGRIVLLVATIAVIVAVIATLFGWLDYLANMVRLGEIANKIEARARRVLQTRASAPTLGGRALDAVRPEAHPVHHAHTGYVTFLDMAALQETAEAAGGAIHVLRQPGTLADPSTPLALTSWPPDDKAASAIRDAFTVRPERVLDHDPRFALCMMSEIASRALSPGINDPGTAIAVIGRLQRLLTGWIETLRETADDAPEPDHPRVHVAPLAAGDLFADAFGPLARDGAAHVEVGIRLQKCLAALATIGGPEFEDAARTEASRALAQARAALTLESDVTTLAAIFPVPASAMPEDAR
jgi:uncharacterized membrane protein